MLGAISWHRWSHLYMRSYSGTATHEGDERASTTEKRARATRDKGEAFPMLKHWKRVGVTNETIGNRQLAFIVIHLVLLRVCASVEACLVFVGSICIDDLAKLMTIAATTPTRDVEIVTQSSF